MDINLITKSWKRRNFILRAASRRQWWAAVGFLWTIFIDNIDLFLQNVAK